MSTWASVAALKKVDLPTLGFPTSPMRTSITEGSSLLFYRGGDVVVTLDLSDGDVKFREVQLAVTVKVHALHEVRCFNAGQGRDVGSFEGRQKFPTVNFAGVVKVH